MKASIDPRYLRQTTAQHYLSCSEACLKRLIKDGYITPKYIPTDKQPRIDREEIDQLMKGKDKDATKILSADAIVDEFLEQMD
ncbi:helix-turn-helix transcriptional regulator [Kiloniella antarctica]|uniref:Helix-turn-helix transcriptional regulator n=1 Tax=Kiloniella antarctica TaxID=1550907 RepID=A0ABW5BQK0_9PROT